jgi:Transglutaminase-like superfamily
MLSKFAALSPAARMLLLKAFLALLRASIGVWCLPLGKLRAGQRLSDHADTTPQHVAWAIGAVTRFVPRTTCLVRAIATRELLVQSGHKCDVFIGVAKSDREPFWAHAWVECEGLVIMGASAVDYCRLLSWSSTK